MFVSKVHDFYSAGYRAGRQAAEYAAIAPGGDEVFVEKIRALVLEHPLLTEKERSEYLTGLVVGRLPV